MALLKDLLGGTVERLVDGQRAGDWSVAEIRTDRVSLRRGERTEELELVRGETPRANSEKKRRRKGRRVDGRNPNDRKAVAERRKRLMERRARQRAQRASQG